MKPGQRFITFIFATAIALLAISIFVTYQTGLIALRAQRKLSSDLTTITRLDDYLACITDAETGQRGFLLTGDPAYLTPFQTAQSRVKSASAAVRELASQNRLSQTEVSGLLKAGEKKMIELEETVLLRRDKGFDAALARVRSGAGRGYMEEVRERVGQLHSAKEKDFQQAATQGKEAGTVRAITFVSVGLVNLGFLFWAFRRILNDLRQREASTLEIARQQKHIQDVLTRSKEELEGQVATRTKELRETVHELEHVSYAITHDMRAPLRAMISYSQILLEDGATPPFSEETQDFLRRILVAASRLDKLIVDAFDYTRAVLTEAPLQPVDLDKFMHGLLRTYPNLHPDVADITIDGRLPVVMGRESLLTQCFSNLLGNAVKFVPKGVRPKIVIRPEARGSAVRIWIEDNGIGIPAASLNRLFRMFERLSSDYEGTGIGLAIVRKVVDRMEGGAGAESEPGRGSRFWVELKVADAAQTSNFATPLIKPRESAGVDR
jgi:signal transduction histidine kinase